MDYPWHVYKNLDEDVTAFIEYYSGHEVTFHRLAILSEHVDEYGLETQPREVKEDGSFKDPRSYDLDYTVQAEALDPPAMAAILEVGIECLIDMDIHAKAQRAEKQIRGKLIKRMAKA